ncbi:MAG: hypothetical protein J6W96_02020 [Alphaproteobacteria bacterium]|nr:hypothetical protein [Alphaproteobacteria bacterium]
MIYSLDELVGHGFLEEAKFLIAAGADVNKISSYLLEGCDQSFQEFIENYKKSQRIAENKKAYKKASMTSKRTKKQISGVVVADEIAKDVISGKEKRTITPKVGKELREKMMRERYSKKKEK